MSDRTVVIVSAVRTPIGSYCGSLSSLKASDLGTVVIKESLIRAGLKGSDVSEVIMGQILTATEGQNPARQAAINAGIPIHVPAYQVNMLCGSGLKSVMTGYCSIKSGESEVVVAGGQENMSRAPHATYLRAGIKFGSCNLIDTLLDDGLTDAFYNIHMAITAENLAEKYAITREAQDYYATKSQQKAEAAINAGYFDKEITPVTIESKKESIVISKDEFPKFGTTTEKLAKLRPAFKPSNGTVTAGNASGINDGAAAVILMSQEAAESKGISPLASIVAFAQVGVEPQIMGIGPVEAVKLVLKKANWTKEEVDIYELNEAFAVQAIVCVQELGLDPEKVNVNGGGIALGHPVGMSGTRILVTLLHTLERTGKKKGIASLCIGGGMGIAIAIERK
ncbi:acetyl-CoA acetyltransferase, cytosolic [Pogonomyrmex barbatus]|uniref:Acetyl-CoA acetyltransferase, cytosolic n=1 Tax=Pogonomyrmex barbatus TaxID=144034 RepID=A0A6I9WLV3_9HYME|nr:acetyl-CoA acetyltransferase, cytosolic [Pogonomyrmex barbatus]XP_011644283.1 acetyl-CoA acetyltransferase, cytosolic [Pogonomyrmex barbatus]XP_011644288.1 acetyl-CoA acetyltransferase, cytosolic [Pogonomyrmex barbatus]